jgi:predicted N-acetyltransferase YhbS
MPVPIVYALEPGLSAQEFRSVLASCTLGGRRPIDEPERLEQMLRNADVIVTARADGKLVGVARAVTDFAFCCYLSDLAVDESHQHQGIGKRLIAETRAAAGVAASLFLFAVPSAEGYYPKVGMRPMHSGWVIRRDR